MTVSGVVNYQACDDKVCYPPAEVPVTWELRVHPMDLNRSPEAIQDKRN